MMKRLFLLLLLAFPVLGRALNAPSGLTSTAGWTNGTVTMACDFDANPGQWYIYVNGTLNASPTRSQVSLQGSSQFVYTLGSVAATSLPATINMKAIQGTTVSALSSSMVVTGTANPISISGAVSVTASVLPTGAATEATLAVLNGKVVVVNTGAVSVSSSALPAGAATESSLAAFSAKATVINTGAVSVSSSALPAGASTEATLSALNAKATVINTGAVSVSSSALPAGAATESSLAAFSAKAIVINTGAVSVSSSALPAGAATEATLSALNVKATVINTGAVSVSSSALPAGASTAAAQTTANSTLSSILTALSGVTGTTVVLVGSDRALPIYTTVTSGSLPTTPYYLSQFGPGYGYAANTTPTGGASYTSPVRTRFISTNAYALSVTYASKAFGTTYTFLTPASATKLTLVNPVGSGQTVQFRRSTTSAVTTDTSDTREELAAGGRIDIENSVCTYLEFWCEGGTPTKKFIVVYEWDNPRAGTSY